MSKRKELEIFDFKGNGLRVGVVDGEVWFVLKDVCDMLGLRVNNTKRTLDNLDISNSSSIHLRVPNVNRGMNLVNESGLYQCIFNSRKKEAKEFTRWVTKEVLPTIRKTGGYISPLKDTVSLEEIDDIVVESTSNHQKWLDSRKEILKVTKENMDLKKELSATVTKVDITSISDNMVSKSEFELFQKTINEKMGRLIHNNKSPRVLRKELKTLVSRYGTKINVGDQHVWGEVYKELGKEYKVAIVRKGDSNKLDRVAEYGLLPEAIEMVESWIEEDDSEIFVDDLFDDECVSLEDV